jgi:hypothetical protein
MADYSAKRKKANDTTERLGLKLIEVKGYLLVDTHERDQEKGVFRKTLDEITFHLSCKKPD